MAKKIRREKENRKDRSQTRRPRETNPKFVDSGEGISFEFDGEGDDESEDGEGDEED